VINEKKTKKKRKKKKERKCRNSGKKERLEI
jgi:hypothetical protein